MSRQLQAKEILLVGDSNIRRNLLHAGRAYSQPCDCGLARNQEELQTALQMIQPDKYKIVIFAMATNLIVAAGNSSPTPAVRVASVESYVKTLIAELRFDNFLL
jgi:hypothetical protein